ncbi:hypothetical protein L596_023708 [Steinernema carpocapsae]|uniref:G-protein coupled receptors family 1 profile domain-containing protein n=1 Tax=Steinernema carpocapsae TaxID=34508 RepID=A0A4U5MEG5_STECR|nr:hypothetical protein L596_023708 [Steinernema carpocapsae]
MVSLIPVCFFLAEFNNVASGFEDSEETMNSTYSHYMVVIMFTFNFSILGLYLIVALKYKLQMEKTSVATRSTQMTFNKIVLGIVVVYFLTWCLPKWFNIIIVYTKQTGNLFEFALIFPEECELVSAALNIFVYGFSHRDLRNALLRTFRQGESVQVLSISAHSSSRPQH